MMAQVISEHSRRPALKRGKTAHRFGPPAPQPLRQNGEGIGFLRGLRLVGNIRVPAARPDPLKGVAGQIRVSAQVRMTERAVEKENMRQSGQVLKGLDRIEARG